MWGFTLFHAPEYGVDMNNHENASCGTCNHFGDGISAHQLVQIRVNPEASATVIAGCKAPVNAALHLQVNPTSHCDGWSPVAA